MVKSMSFGFFSLNFEGVGMSLLYFCLCMNPVFHNDPVCWITSWTAGRQLYEATKTDNENLVLCREELPRDKLY